MCMICANIAQYFSLVFINRITETNSPPPPIEKQQFTLVLSLVRDTNTNNVTDINVTVSLFALTQ